MLKIHNLYLWVLWKGRGGSWRIQEGDGWIKQIEWYKTRIVYTCIHNIQVRNNYFIFNISEWYSHIYIEQRELAHNETSWTKHWNLDDSDCFAWIHPANQRNHDESWLHHLDSFDACFFCHFLLKKRSNQTNNPPKLNWSHLKSLRTQKLTSFFSCVTWTPVKLSPGPQNWCRKPPTETWTISHQAFEAIGLLEMTIFPYQMRIKKNII